MKISVLGLNFLFVCELIVFFMLFFLFGRWPAQAFQTEIGAVSQANEKLTDLEIVESGLFDSRPIPLSLKYLAESKYADSLASLRESDVKNYPWLPSYLTNLTLIEKSWVKIESQHFVLAVPRGQEFLADYALPVLEQVRQRMSELWGQYPDKKVQVEIYPSKEAFSAGSTLSMETLAQSGAIGICKYHRIMILTPQALPMGYRWLDALSHEYLHLLINELSHTKVELWLHEGTARYYETIYREDPPRFLTPDQKSKLLKAAAEDGLIPFKRMSPSMVYLKNQEEVSLAFGEVSYAVGHLVADHGHDNYAKFLQSMQTKTFSAGFIRSFSMTPETFEVRWQSLLKNEKWEKTRGSMSDEIRFSIISEDQHVGADAKNQVRLGDKMRQKQLYDAALIQYERALEQEPDNAVILLKAAKTHLALGQTELAVGRLNRAVEKNPNYQTPRLELVPFVSVNEGVNHLLHANAINPFHPKVHWLLAEAYSKLGKADMAAREREIFQLLSQ